MIKKRSSKRGARRSLGTYSNLTSRRRTKKDMRTRRKAEYLATLPKHPIKRTLHRMHPKRFMAYWFSREGGIMALKIGGVAILFMVLVFGALFAYFRRELDAIRPGELSKRVQTTVTKYYDRNNVLLWEDKGDGNYKLVVKEKEISEPMKQATIAIEDKDFYKHGGVSITGITRAFVNNFSGGDTQGGSTLTQQLVKQVFFADEASKRGLGGVPRKIKEAILAVEVERMYDKNQILTLYLNESPYGGRRNGVESGAQTYFGKSAKDLNVPEAALLASIPQQPGLYDPYNPEGHKALITRQQRVIDNMVEQGFITEKEGSNAKKVAVLDTIKPETDQFKNIRAPHFVQMVRSDLESQLGKATVGRGGLTVKTTLDWRAQEVVERSMSELFASYLPNSANFDNGAATVVDVPTGQILAMQGSRSYEHPGYGQDNAANSFIQPGSSIKPFVYAGLFKQKPAGQPNYGAGSVLSDEPIDNIYGAKLNNFDNRFKGNMSVRQALAQSRNIPAVKAMYITGRDATLQTIHDVGDKSYCTQGVDKQVGLAASIGGCGLKQTEHANSFATLGRMGIYKPVASILEVKNAQGDTIKKWKDEGKQVLDSQIPYMINEILSDDGARSPSFGYGASGFNVPGVKTATKTGTSNLGNFSKDLWMNSYTPKAALSIWVGNHDTTPMSNALSSIVGPTVNKIMGPIHTDIFQKDGSWKPEDWFKRPAGIQTLTVSGRTDIFPSWYNKAQVQTGTKMVFDRVSKKKATNCTPDAAKVEVIVQKVQDPVTRKTTIMASDGYDASGDDTIHQCNDVKPFISNITATRTGNTCRVTVRVNQGTHQLESATVSVGGTAIASQAMGGTGDITANAPCTPGGTIAINVTAKDTALYEGTGSRTVAIPPNPTTDPPEED